MEFITDIVIPIGIGWGLGQIISHYAIKLFNKKFGGKDND